MPALRGDVPRAGIERDEPHKAGLCSGVTWAALSRRGRVGIHSRARSSADRVSMVGRIRPPATKRRESRQARKGAAAAAIFGCRGVAGAGHRPYWSSWKVS